MKRFQIVSSLEKLPRGSKIHVQGFSVDPVLWRDIRREADAAIEQSEPRWLSSIKSIGSFAALLLGMATAPYLHWNAVCAGIAAVIAMVLWLIAWDLMTRGRSRRIRREVMAKHGLPVCIQCGYNLQGQPDTGGCPECGWQRPSNPAERIGGMD